MSELVKQSVLETKVDYIKLNQSQLASGLTKDDEPVTLDGNAEYSPMTIAIKEQTGHGIGAITDHITTFMTGSMWATETLDVDDDGINLAFHTDYSDALVERTGDRIFGLTEVNRGKYVKGPFLDALRPKVTEIMKLEFI